MVNEKFASLLEGIGYADALPITNKFEDISGAWPKAEAAAKYNGARLVCTQIYGDNLITAETCSSFARESWAQVPDSPPWGSLPLVFDQRDSRREAGVTRNLLQNSTGKPYVVCCTSGTSSPFAGNRELMRHLRRTLREEFDLVDVSAFIAPRFFDLLGVMEDAHCILTVDSGLLHLAHACPKVPVVALITREPSLWHGSPWRPSHVARFFYDEIPEHTGDVIEAVKRARNGAEAVRFSTMIIKYEPEPPKTPVVFHHVRRNEPMRLWEHILQTESGFTLCMWASDSDIITEADIAAHLFVSTHEVNELRNEIDRLKNSGAGIDE